MTTQIFVNLPVNNLPKSVAFFTALGFSFNPQFTDETATCMVVSDSIFVMLLTHEKFKGFIPKQIADATQSSEVLVCLSADNREKVGRHRSQGGRRRRQHVQRAARLWFHVRPWLSGPGRSYLGICSHGPQRLSSGLNA